MAVSLDAHFKNFVIVSVPEKDFRESRVVQAVGGRGSMHPVSLPRLRVGTLDSLLQLSDELQRLDMSLTATMGKIARSALDLKSGAGLPQVEVRPGEYVSPEGYLQFFEWSENFPARQKLDVLVENIAKDMHDIEDRIRMDSGEVANIRNELQGMERKESGSLQSRSLYGVVNASDILDSSDTLTSLFVYVPNHLKKNFEQNYENLGRDPEGKCWVVPRSKRVVEEDSEGTLYRIFCFKIKVDDIKKEIRESKMVPRELDQDEGSLDEQSERKRDLQENYESLRRDLEASVPGSFSQAFTSWVHLKMIRVFVDSVLRYGLPPDFAFFIVRCERKHERKVRQQLLKLYEHLGGAGFQSSDLDHAEYLPFVCNVASL